MKRLAVLLAVVSVSLASCGNTSKYSDLSLDESRQFAQAFYAGAASALMLVVRNEDPSLAAMDSCLALDLTRAGASPNVIRTTLVRVRMMDGTDLMGPR